MAPWEDITDLQRRLWGAGFGAVCGDVDGIYGPKTTEAVRRFQEAYALAPPMPVDGVVGPITWPSLVACSDSGGHLSDHFRTGEFADPSDGSVRVLRGLVEALEVIRLLDGQPLRIVSGYRTSDHNADVGGAAHSQHLVGAAADIPAKWPSGVVRGLEVFSGIGFDSASDLVIHVDVRHLGDWPDGSTPAHPALWTY